MLIVEDLRRALDRACEARDAFHEAAVNDDDLVVVRRAAELKDDLDGIVERTRVLLRDLS